MPKEYSRTERVADYLRRELGAVMQQELRDPRVGMVSVTDVEVSRDLSDAKVYVTFMGAESAKEAEDRIEVLNKATGFLRSAIARQATMRTTPRLRFLFDASVGRGRHLSSLIDRALESDRDLHAANDESGGE